MKHFCDIHKIYFEYDENGIPDCEKRLAKKIINSKISFTPQ